MKNIRLVKRLFYLWLEINLTKLSFFTITFVHCLKWIPLQYRIYVITQLKTLHSIYFSKEVNEEITNISWVNYKILCIYNKDKYINRKKLFIYLYKYPEAEYLFPGL